MSLDSVIVHPTLQVCYAVVTMTDSMTNTTVYPVGRNSKRSGESRIKMPLCYNMSLVTLFLL